MSIELGGSKEGEKRKLVSSSSDSFVSKAAYEAHKSQII